MKYSFNEQISQAKKEYGLGENFYTIRDGENRLRVISPSIPVQSSWQGKLTTKFVTYVIDRTDGKVKLVRLPYIVVKAIGALQVNEEYHFEELPMPYDIIIQTTNAGTKAARYQVL